MFPLYDDNPHRRTPLVVIWFILLNLAVMAIESLQGSPRALELFVWRWGLVPAALWHAPDLHVWFTPLTSMFLHGGWLHLAGNCWFLWLFGNNIEDRLGHLAFIAFYLLGGLGAAALQVAIAPGSLVPMIGASGAISAVLGAYMRYFPRAPVYTLIPFWLAPIVPVPAFVFILVWFALQFWNGVGTVFATGMTGGVAWWAHIGGFATGFALAPLMAPPRRRR